MAQTYTKINLSLSKFKDWPEARAFTDKIEKILEDEGLKWYYCESTFFNGHTREICYYGATQKSDEIKALMKQRGLDEEEYIIEFDEED